MVESIFQTGVSQFIGIGAIRTIGTLPARLCKNVYVDLDGTIRPHKFPKSGLWKFDGQVFYLPRRQK